jgi:hypothetical protein
LVVPDSEECPQLTEECTAERPKLWKETSAFESDEWRGGAGATGQSGAAVPQSRS